MCTANSKPRADPVPQLYKKIKIWGKSSSIAVFVSCNCVMFFLTLCTITVVKEVPKKMSMPQVACLFLSMQVFGLNISLSLFFHSRW